VAARLANGVEPFEWSEYDAPFSPYVIADNWAAMSGIEYEVRVSSVNADGRSEWSSSVVVTAPELRVAPADAISLEAPQYPRRPLIAGDNVEVHLLTQRPFTRKSQWLWSVCDSNGANCEGLLVPPSSTMVVPSAAVGKLLQVQVDYDKNGVSYSATKKIGMTLSGAVPPAGRSLEPSHGCRRTEASSRRLDSESSIETHLHLLKSELVQIAWDGQVGGAMEPLCNDLLVASSHGEIALARSDGRVERVDGRVPMNLEGLTSHPDSANFRLGYFRVADILIKATDAGKWELFVTHHYFTGECIRFRLSAAEILMDGGSVSVSPPWRTVFDAEPCLPPTYEEGNQAGGRMLTDGPDHLLIVIGDHGGAEFPQDPGSHMGKLVRTAIETGEAEILAFGLRNSQGLARDEDGNLWATDHGPQGGDELNLLEAGSNYGWPAASYGVGYGGYALKNGEAGEHEGFAKPRFAWIPSVAVSALVVNDERSFPLWKDDLLVASLSGGGNGHSLFRVRRDGTTVLGFERIEVGYRIRDLAQMPDGRLALLSDGGRVHFISPLAHCDDWAREARVIYALGCGPPENAAKQGQ